MVKFLVYKNYILQCNINSGWIDPVHTNTFLNFHKLTEPVVNNASLVFVGLHMSFHTDLLSVTEPVIKYFKCYHKV